MQERRKYVRTNGLVLVNYKEVKIEGKSSAYDVGGGGLRIIVDNKLLAGAAIGMEIYLPGESQPIIAKGEVVWIAKFKKADLEFKTEPDKEYYYTGIKFTSIDENNRNKIMNYVTRRLNREKKGFALGND